MSDLEGGVSWLILIFWVMACARSCWRGIGALATGYEKSSELVDELVKKGEITVEQGKALNIELKRKVSETVEDAKKAAAEAGDQSCCRSRHQCRRQAR